MSSFQTIIACILSLLTYASTALVSLVRTIRTGLGVCGRFLAGLLSRKSCKDIPLNHQSCLQSSSGTRAHRPGPIFAQDGTQVVPSPEPSPSSVITRATDGSIRIFSPPRSPPPFDTIDHRDTIGIGDVFQVEVANEIV
ncbi:hypothetical protein EDD37DRAFT_640890 [Exophiala viscosa]|uniref:uncharacterized protein n=1 Tax=Exophiala viscosa TaxID=2486360 RepID=UPI00219D98CD|nr:hypothetical protein EDD37DRAFT_640890 [Exophiala viscosa]